MGVVFGIWDLLLGHLYVRPVYVHYSVLFGIHNRGLSPKIYWKASFNIHEWVRKHEFSFWGRIREEGGESAETRPRHIGTFDWTKEKLLIEPKKKLLIGPKKKMELLIEPKKNLQCFFYWSELSVKFYFWLFSHLVWYPLTLSFFSMSFFTKNSTVEFSNEPVEL